MLAKTGWVDGAMGCVESLECQAKRIKGVWALILSSDCLLKIHFLSRKGGSSTLDSSTILLRFC